MKVTTDACVFGAYVAYMIREHARIFAQTPSIHIVDVGTGTGLLALMLAQQVPLPFQITALEIDARACEQAEQNFAASPWKHHLQAIHADVRTWCCTRPADLIICNPPFYHRQLSSSTKERALAFHDHQLQLEDLLRFADQYLTVMGWLAVLLPSSRKQEFDHLAYQYGLHLIGGCQMYATTRVHAPHVVAGIYSRRRIQLNQWNCVYQDEEGHYMPLFRAWLRPYYLHI